MKKNQLPKKLRLQLHRETLRTLEAPQIAEAVGAIP